MNPLINQLSTAIRYASKGLMRDYSELEHLQSSNHSTQGFVAKSYGKIKSILQQELTKVEHVTTQFVDHPKVIVEEGLHIIVNPLEGMNNLNKALPFFGTIITVIKCENQQITPLTTVINLPATSELLYAEKSQGVWLEKASMQTGTGSVRLRCSSTKNWSDAVISLSQISDNNLFNKYKALRIFGSYAYALTLCGAGKLDAAVFNKNDLASFYAAQLISIEAGGKNYALNAKPECMVVTNMFLPEL